MDFFSNPKSLDAVLFEEAHRSERQLNTIRMVIWLVFAVVSLGLALVHGVMPHSETFINIGWAIGAFISGLWLRKHYHPMYAILSTAMDLLVVTWVMYALQVDTVASKPVEATHALYASCLGLMLTVSANILRPWRAPIVIHTVMAIGCYAWLLHQFARIDLALIFDVIEFLSFCGGVLLLVYKQRNTIRRVQERDAFARFLPGPIVAALSKDPGLLKLGGEELEATILFADIRGFTTMSAGMTPTEVVAMLNEYFGEMVDELFRHNGVLDKFIGDGLCAVFHQLGPAEKSATGVADVPSQRAILCALGMLKRLDALNVRREKRGQPPLKIGIGLHSGQVLAGNIGTSARMEYTHIGDVVNVASRLEGLTKDAQSPLVASAQTLMNAREGQFVTRDLGPLAVKGKDETVHVFAVSAGTP